MSRRAWLTGDTSTAVDFICRRLFIPNDLDYIIAVNGALTLLTEAQNWEKFGAANPDQAAALMFEMYQEYLESDACMIGTIQPFATENPPNATLLCDGAQYQRVDYPTLYERILPALVVDEDNFLVPDLRDSFVLGAGPNHAPLDTGGAETHTLVVDEMPEHSHDDTGHTHTEAGTTPTAGGEIPTSAAVGTPSVTGTGFANIQPTGGGQAHENMPPFLALRYCIVAR